MLGNLSLKDGEYPKTETDSLTDLPMLVAYLESHLHTGVKHYIRKMC